MAQTEKKQSSTKGAVIILAVIAVIAIVVQFSGQMAKQLTGTAPEKQMAIFVTYLVPAMIVMAVFTYFMTRGELTKKKSKEEK